MRRVFEILEHLPQLFKICSHLIIGLQPVPGNQLFLGIIAPLSTFFSHITMARLFLRSLPCVYSN